MPRAAVGQDAPDGLRAGPLIIQPSVAITTGYDDNIFISETNEQESLVVTIEPRLVVETDWSRHGLRLETGGRYRYLAESTDDNTTEAELTLNGHLDVLRAIQIEATVGFHRSSEQRGEDDTGTAISGPVTAITLDGDLRANITLGRFRLTPFFEFTSRDFEDVTLTLGGTGNQDDRDRMEYGGGFELGYELQRWIEIFVGARYGAVDFDAPVDDTGVNRDSSTWQAVAGVTVDLSEVLRGSASLGVQSRSFDDKTLSDVSGLAADVALVWSITPLTRVEALGSHSFSETTIAGASIVAETELSIEFTHDLRRNLSLSMNFGYGRESFKGSPRFDNVYGAGARAVWQVTPLFTLAPEYRFRMQRSNVAGEDFGNHQFFVTATYGFR